MILYTDDMISFNEGEFYTVQQLLGLPDLPPGKISIGSGYNVVATAGVPDLAGSVNFQYLEHNVLLAKAAETDLAIYFWSETTGQWQTLDTLVDPYFNTAVARSQGSGVYALLAGSTIPAIASVTPALGTNDVTTTLTISGNSFLWPLQVNLLISPTETYRLPITSWSPLSVTAVINVGLPAREYEVVVYNNNQPGGAKASNPGTFALFAPEEACFYDFFESGASKWQLSGDWGIVILPNGERTMTDSPAGPYRNAGDYGAGLTSYTTAITSQPFDLAGCSNPTLTFRYDYVLAKVGTSQDVGRVEISSDDGVTWNELATYTGGGIFGVSQSDASSPEWANPNWQNGQVNLSAYTGTVRLRLSLTVDAEASARGWLVDNLKVVDGNAAPPVQPIYLPIIQK